jgi:hypothetical protein
MKKPARITNALILIFVIFAVIYGCTKDNNTLIQHRWLITTDEVTLEFHPDSTFTGSERGEAFTGTWKLADNGKSVIFKKKGKSEKKLKIKELSATKLTLSDNGLDQDYVRGD